MRRRPLFVLVVLGLLAFLTPVVPAGADVRPEGLLPDDATVVRWSGQFSAAVTGPVAPDPAACTTAAACDTVTVDLAVPSRAWTGSPGGLLVAIQWPVMDAGYDLDLYVYRTGDPTPVASSTSTAFSRHEAAWIPNPPPGRYVVVVAAKSVVAQSLVPRLLTPLRYDGVARVERGLTVDRTETDRGLPFTRRFVAFGAATAGGGPLL
ncbi:MAG TPA: hypothetical protein VGP90_04290, partial [Acidimicrobiia bacterium]|nr:hypothetical protein [Acidimicrobiia bacterium]